LDADRQRLEARDFPGDIVAAAVLAKKTPGGRIIQPPGVFLGDRCAGS